MMALVQTVGAMVGVIVAALFFAGGPDPAPWPIYAVAAFASGYGAMWLYARWKYGKDVKVTFSRRVD